MSDISSLVTTTVLNTKIGEAENNIPDHAKYITTQERNKLKVENFIERLKQADLVTKHYFDTGLWKPGGMGRCITPDFC